MTDPIISLAVRAYLSEPVSMAQIARILGIGEKAFSRIVKLNVAMPKTAKSAANSAGAHRSCDSEWPEEHGGRPETTYQTRAGVAPCRHIQFHTSGGKPNAGLNH